MHGDRGAKVHLLHGGLRGDAHLDALAQEARLRVIAEAVLHGAPARHATDACVERGHATIPRAVRVLIAITAVLEELTLVIIDRPTLGASERAAIFGDLLTDTIRAGGARGANRVTIDHDVSATVVDDGDFFA